jgi:phage baseplate assembly protein W
MATFKGFSTVGKVRAPFVVTDAELVKRDLLNTFYTKKGERVMRPNYGSIIWDLLMDPEDTTTNSEIIEDVKRIVDADPRVEYVDTTIYTLDHTIRIEVELSFLPFNNKDILYIEYIREISEGVS